MKILFTSLICLLLAFAVKAQFIYNDEGDVIPYSMTEKYKNLIDTARVNTCTLKNYNNDSLYVRYNKDNISATGDIMAGFPIDTLIDIRTKATIYQIDEGTLWLYKVESKTAEMLNIDINNLVIPDGAYICIFPKKEELSKKGPKLFLKKDIANPNFHQHQYGNQLFIEYFEPNKASTKADIVISKIHYMFTSPFKKKDNEIDNSNAEPKLKSGNFIMPYNTDACQFNVACPEVSTWAKESRSIVYINFFFYSADGFPVYKNGTGFLVNKANNYSDTDQPYMITAGHMFASWKLINNVWTYTDLSTQIYDYEFRVNYRDEACNDPVPRTGQLLDGTFNIILKGSSYDKNAITDATYEQNEDFALIQCSKTVSSFKKYNVLYAGWTATPNFNSTGYGAIGHPGADVQKVLIENGIGNVPTSGRYVKFYFDKGVADSGFSGAPAFNSSKKVVGWLCTLTTIPSCPNVGLNTDATLCGRFDRLYFNIAQYIDPTNIAQANDSEPTTPSAATLPSHCTNCIMDSDETGIDCGGSCLPCGMQDVRTLKTQADITSSNISARYALNTEPDSGYKFEYISGTFNLKAGNSVSFKNNVVIKSGVNLKAAVVPSLLSEPPRGCQNPCIDAANIFTPNGDGNNDYWIFNQSFVSSYSLIVKNSWGNTLYTKSSTSIYENGTVLGWDGTGVSSIGTYYVLLTYIDCGGTTRNTSYTVYVSGLKSLDLSGLQDNLTNNESNIEEDKTFKIKAYPNPTSGKVLIEANNCDLVFDYFLTDMTGKILSQVSNVSGSDAINLSTYPSGMYLLHLKSGENIQLCKLIKK